MVCCKIRELRLPFLFDSFHPQTNLTNFCPQTNLTNFWQNRDRPHRELSLAAVDIDTTKVIDINLIA